jgi:hypothetical protein
MLPCVDHVPSPLTGSVIITITYVPSALNVIVAQSVRQSSDLIPFCSMYVDSQVPKSSGANIAASSPQPTTLAKAITASTVINPNSEPTALIVLEAVQKVPAA